MGLLLVRNCSRLSRSAGCTLAVQSEYYIGAGQTAFACIMCHIFSATSSLRGNHRKVPRARAHTKRFGAGGFSILVRAPEIWLNKSLLLRWDENLKRVTAGRPLALFTSGVCQFLSNFHAGLVNLNGKLGLIYLAGRVIIGLCGAGKASGQAPVLILNVKLCPVINVAR